MDSFHINMNNEDLHCSVITVLENNVFKVLNYNKLKQDKRFNLNDNSVQKET